MVGIAFATGAKRLRCSLVLKAASRRKRRTRLARSRRRGPAAVGDVPRSPEAFEVACFGLWDRPVKYKHEAPASEFRFFEPAARAVSLKLNGDLTGPATCL